MALKGDALKLQASGKRAYVNVTLLETYQADDEGLNYFGGLQLLELKVSDQDIHDSYQTQLRPTGVWSAIKGFLQFSIAHSTVKKTFSWPYPSNTSVPAAPRD